MNKRRLKAQSALCELLPFTFARIECDSISDVLASIGAAMRAHPDSGWTLAEVSDEAPFSALVIRRTPFRWGRR